MADNEVSKVMWIAIVVALAATIFAIAKPQINTLTNGVFDKVENVVKDINTNEDSKTEPSKNLIVNSTWNQGQGTWTEGFNARFDILDPEPDKPTSHILHSKPSTRSTQQVLQNKLDAKMEAGKTYTVSFDYKELNHSMNTNILALRIFAFSDPSTQEGWKAEDRTLNGEAWYAGKNALEEFAITSESENVPVDGVKEWKRISFTFTPKSDGYLGVIPYDSDKSGKHESFWRELQVEEGSTATEWEDNI